MDFFSAQDLARRRTVVLAGLLLAATVGVIGLVYLVVVAAWALSNIPHVTISGESRLWNLTLLRDVSIAVSVIIVGGSIYKIAELRRGGSKVAQMLGGHLVPRNTDAPLQQRLLNVVDEMAIASGIAAPPVYVLDEDGINAFAAGHSVDDAVIGVTRGALEALNRDELQGVIAHEFSHILNGDMVLNLRLMGYGHGLLAIGLVGRYVLRGSWSKSGRFRNTLHAFAFGLVLAGIGALGFLMARLVQAAISRQREYLADASAVQFTRNPSGIGGALQKIQGAADGSLLAHPMAPAVGHLLFGSGYMFSLSRYLSTHPPLKQRIERVFGAKLQVSPIAGGVTTTAPLDGQAASVSGFAGPTPAIARRANRDRACPLRDEDLLFARNLLKRLPWRVRAALKEPFSARAVIYGMLISHDDDCYRRQLQHLSQYADRPVLNELQTLLPDVEKLEPETRLPLVEMAIPALQQLSQRQTEIFFDNVEQLSLTDQRITVFEWCVKQLLLRLLRAHQRREETHVHGAAPRRAAISFVEASSRVLSTLAYAGHHDISEARLAFNAAAVALARDGVHMLEREDCGLLKLRAALDALFQASSKEKQATLAACDICMRSDGRLAIEEKELVRTIAVYLGYSVPVSTGTETH